MSKSKVPPGSTDLLELVNQVYPGWEGFEDSRFVEEERAYKVQAAELAQKLLHGKKLRGLIETGAYEEVLSRVRKVAERTNLLYRSTPKTGDLAVLEQDTLPIERQSELVFD